MLHAAIPLGVALALLTSVGAKSAPFPFKDVSRKAGLKYPLGRRAKYGGPAVADLDGDGFPDLIFGHHNEPYSELYFNNRDGTFEKSSWGLFQDMHGINPFRYSPKQKRMHFCVSVGGSNGQNPKPPLFFAILDKRRVKEVQAHKLGVKANGRGRSALFLSLRPGRGKTDAILLGAPSLDRSPFHSAFGNVGGLQFKRKPLGKFSSTLGNSAIVTDVDGNGRLEIVTFHVLRIIRVVAPFLLKDITRSVLPSRLDIQGVGAIAELDYDNDGRWDLYLARGAVNHVSWVPRQYHGDMLLRNVGGRYVDVTARAGIPKNIRSAGVTVADFNNDGWMDLVLPQARGPDLMLKNRGDGTFIKQNAGLKRKRGILADMATAVDYDRDGRVDLIVSEGSWNRDLRGGFYRILRNVGSHGNFIHLRIRNSPKGGATSLHAVAKVFIGSKVMMRRVGSPGTLMSNSYIELLHFGIGKRRGVSKIVVRWADGSRQTRFKVKAGSYLTLGK